MKKAHSEEFYYQKVLPEILLLHRQVVDKLKESPLFESVYNGWKVWFSPIIDNPKILFIGINPGGVEGDEPDVEPDGQLQYIYDESKTWYLKNDTLEVFYDTRISNKIDLEDCVKTNYYYLATRNFDDNFYKLIDFLGRQSDKQGLGDIFLEKSKLWTKQLIEVLRPKIIVCEGVTAFDLVTEYALDNKISRSDEDVLTFKDLKHDIHIVGYRRSSPQAGIKNKQLLIDCLENLL